MEQKKNICKTCGKKLDESNIFCPNCGENQKDNTDKSITCQNSLSVAKFKDKVKNIMRKWSLIPSDIIAILGALITLSGIYVFHFLDMTLPFLGHQTSTLAGSVKFLKQILSFGESLGTDSSISSVIHQLQFFIIAITILPLIVIICVFINKKLSKIISGIAALSVTILYFTFTFKVQSAIALASDSKDFIQSLFGPARVVIIIGLLVMLGGVSYTLYHEFKKDEKISVDLSKITKKQWIIGGGLVAIVLAVFSLLILANGMQKSVMKDVKVEFSGYDHQGEAILSGNYNEEIDKIMAKETNMSDSDISVDLDKTSGLSNGDKVTVTISSKMKKSPIKSETKTFTVSGLKKSTTYTIDSLIKSVKFKGFNHYGVIEYDENMFNVINDTTELSNGDKITLELSEDYINQESTKGKILEGASSKTVEISGLKDTVQISNFNELLDQIDAVARDDNKSDALATYTVTRQESYFVGKNVNSFWLNNDLESAGQFSILTIYKIDEKSDYGSDSSKYRVYGYSGLTLKNGKVDISSLNNNSSYKDYQSFNSVQEVLDSLKTNYPSISKMK